MSVATKSKKVKLIEEVIEKPITSVLRIKDETGYKHVTFLEDPFCNCQVVGVCYFHGCVTMSHADIHKAFQIAGEKYGKRQFLIDTYAGNLDLINKVFRNETIMFAQPYTNSTGSEMVTVMLLMDDTFPDEDDDDYYDEGNYN